MPVVVDEFESIHVLRQRLRAPARREDQRARVPRAGPSAQRRPGEIVGNLVAHLRRRTGRRAPLVRDEGEAGQTRGSDGVLGIEGDLRDRPAGIVAGHLNLLDHPAESHAGVLLDICGELPAIHRPEHGGVQQVHAAHDEGKQGGADELANDEEVKKLYLGEKFKLDRYS